MTAAPPKPPAKPTTKGKPPAVVSAEQSSELTDEPVSLVLDQDPREQGAVLILENASGAVRAMVGGSDWSQSKFNRATQALRQAGSAFKPFVYLTALEQGFTAADTVFDGPLSIVIDPRQPPYRPGNYDGKFHGMTCRKAWSTVQVHAVAWPGWSLSHVIETAQLGCAPPPPPPPPGERTLAGTRSVRVTDELTRPLCVRHQGLAFRVLIGRTRLNGDLSSRRPTRGRSRRRRPPFNSSRSCAASRSAARPVRRPASSCRSRERPERPTTTRTPGSSA